MGSPPLKVLILGSSGLIGRAFMERFRIESGFSVTGLTSSALDLTVAGADRLLAESFDADTVLIAAARPREGVSRTEALERDTAIATCVAKALERQRVRQCVFLSSTAVYGDEKANTSITEDTPPGPTTLYGLAKFIGESVVCFAARETQQPLLILRVCMVYGPGDTTQAYGPARFMRQILKTGRVELFGDGAEERDYLYLDDLAEIVLRLVRNAATGLYNVTSGESLSFRELALLLKKVTGREFEIMALEQNGTHTSQVVRPAKLREAIGNFTFTALQDGLKKTWVSQK